MRRCSHCGRLILPLQRTLELAGKTPGEPTRIFHTDCVVIRDLELKVADLQEAIDWQVTPSHHDKLYEAVTQAELERLAILSEECGEVTQVISKIIRHGFNNHHPDRPMQTNKNELISEIGDLLAIIRFMVTSKDFHIQDLYKDIGAKNDKLVKWLRHQERSDG